MRMEMGGVTVVTTKNRGFTPEEIAERAVRRIMYVSDLAPPEIKEQALAFRDKIFYILVDYLAEAQRSKVISVAARLTEAGYGDLVKLIDD